MGTVKKHEFIIEKCINKTVLDIGGAEYDYVSTKGEIFIMNHWLHRKITLVAKKVTGLDLSEKVAHFLNHMGYNFIWGDA